MPYWQLFYHLIWSTWGREPWLTPEIEPMAQRFLRNKAMDLGATIYAINGTEDHVHLVAAIPPGIAVSRFVGQVKGVASTRLNKAGLLDHPFRWQEEYGVLSFDRKTLPKIVDYVRRQKEHHAAGAVILGLERVDTRASDSGERKETNF